MRTVSRHGAKVFVTAAAEPPAYDMKAMAAELNAHLTRGGAVYVTTMTRSTRYGTKHAGWFSTDRAGDLRVQSGRRHLCLSFGGKHLLVGITLE